MAKSRLNSQKDKPVHIYSPIHKTLKRIAFQCETSLEKLVNAILEKSLNDRNMLEQVMLELEMDPKCLDEML